LNTKPIWKQFKEEMLLNLQTEILYISSILINILKIKFKISCQLRLELKNGWKECQVCVGVKSF